MPGENCVGGAVNTGDTAWMLFASTFVLVQTPAAGLAQAGLVRRKNALSLITQTIAGVVIGSVLWYIIGLSFTFGPSVGGFIGTFKYGLFQNIPVDDCFPPIATSVPATVWASFQMMFALMVPVLITGSWAEKFSVRAFLLFTIIWPFLVYYPVAHWVWNPEGWLNRMGVLDFAGGLTVHTTAGIAALVVALFVQNRRAHREIRSSSHNIPLTALGGMLIWAGWYSFNGGSALIANFQASTALLNTQISACTASAMWMMIDYIRLGQIRITSLISGALSGLAGITPGSGFVDSDAAFCYGLLIGPLALVSSEWLKDKLQIDDVLDVTSLQAVPGITGTILVAFCANAKVWPDPSHGTNGIIYGGNPKQLGYQLLAVVVIVPWVAFWTYVVLRFIDRYVGVNVTPEVEEDGLDICEYGECAYDNPFEMDTHGLQGKLMEACKAGSTDDVVQLLRKGAKAGTTDYDGRTPLHMAASEGHNMIVKILLRQHDVSINAVDRFGGTPVSDAIDGGRTETVGYLIKKGASVDSSVLKQMFLRACARGNRKRLEQIFTLNILDVNECDYDRRTGLHLAIAEEHVDVVAYLVQHGANTEAVDRWGKTPKQESEESTCVAIRDLLRLPNGSTLGAVNIQEEAVATDPVPMRQPTLLSTHELCAAAAAGDKREVLRLLKKRSDPSLGDYDGRTPLHLAASHGHLSIVKILCEYPSVNVNAVDRWHRTPIQDAMEFPTVVEFLRNRGGLLIDPDVGYRLCAAAATADLNKLRRYHYTGVDIKAADNLSRTALHLAACEGHLEVVQWLVAIGADPYATDRFGHSAIDDAISHQKDDVATFLREYVQGRSSLAAGERSVSPERPERKGIKKSKSLSATSDSLRRPLLPL